MPSSELQAKTVIARVPYLNCLPFFEGFAGDESWEWMDVPPRRLGAEAEAGRVAAGPMALADFLRLQDRFERLGALGIAVRGRCGSTMLFSRKPLRQLDDAVIAVTEETSTTALLLRLILEVRYQIRPKAYQRGGPDDAEAALLIGDEALRAHHAAVRRYPYEVDLAFEWWMWQHLPAVFAVWAVRKDLSAADKQRLSRQLQMQLAANRGRLEALAAGRSPSLGIPPEALKAYLERFVYRFGPQEEDAIARFGRLAHDHHLL
ncbi:MAG: menaquinone biosynthesis protein [Candidatus Omnitrophica bacterium]|nr:menaquinone biosynthesis protein [Candidatus Omnitrophota bacterium]